ncbi:MAG: hypothetical protein GMKNLPBB_02347 [Myxococcota bacterium]|nr:hypothetical protein [Myxococcota bacterium]
MLKPPQTPGGLPNPLDFFDVPPPPNLPPQSAAALDRQSKFQAGMEVNASPLVDDLSGLDFSAATMQASAKEAATARQVSMSRPSAVNPDNPFAGLGGPVTIPRAEGANPFMTERIESSDLPTAVPGMVDSTPSAKSPFVTQPLDLTLGLPNPSRAKKSGVMAGPGRDLVVGSEMRKVAIHFQAGDIKRGFLRQLRSRDQSIQFFEQENGAASDVPMEGVKAVFVMEGKTRFQPPANMVPVTVTFEDGREIGGLTPDKDGNDSFLTIYPTQQRGMVERIFVLRSAVASMRDG